MNLLLNLKKDPLQASTDLFYSKEKKPRTEYESEKSHIQCWIKILNLIYNLKYYMMQAIRDI